MFNHMRVFAIPNLVVDISFNNESPIEGIIFFQAEPVIFHTNGPQISDVVDKFRPWNMCIHAC